ncbi:MAG TPA: SMI1/KNR4 family protein [Gemmataceae bacterium]|nr:SMI1/KNR4 family protein [Gemmataceae bacterium]
MICTAVNTATSKLVQTGLAGPDSFQGCMGEEVKSLEGQFSLRLPQCYRDFLSVMGRAAGEFLLGTDYSFPKMLGFRKDAEGLLQTSQSNFKLPPTAFVFMFHQGYTVLFFDCHDDPDDPPVFMFTEAEKEPRKIADSFSAWLLIAVEDDIAASRGRKGH